MASEEIKVQSGGNKKKKSGLTALKVAGGVIAGAAAGGLAGILFAPDSGKNTRKKIVDNAKAAAFDAKEKVITKVKDIGKKATFKKVKPEETES